MSDPKPDGLEPDLPEGEGITYEQAVEMGRPIPRVPCRAGHAVHATRDEFGRWWVPALCPACARNREVEAPTLLPPDLHPHADEEC